MLVFVMMHAQRPMRMRALLVDLNLRTFIDVRVLKRWISNDFKLFLLQIVRGAYSYFNLLRSSHLN